MHKKTFEVVEFDGEIDEMVDKNHVAIPAEHNKEASELFKTGKKVDVYGETPLSEFARGVKGGNRAYKRAEAKRIRKAFR